MSRWVDFAASEPDLSERVRQCFDAHGHKFIATLRQDGWPRISGIELSVTDEEVWLAGMPRSRKFDDLRRNGRVAIHSGSDEPSSWRADAKLSGHAIAVTDESVKRRFLGDESPPGGDFELFRVDLTEATVIRLGEPADHLVIDFWHHERGRKRMERR